MDKPNILVVDDDKNALQGYLKVLSQDEFSVEGAATGYEALKKIEKQSFDIVTGCCPNPHPSLSEIMI